MQCIINQSIKNLQQLSYFIFATQHQNLKLSNSQMASSALKSTSRRSTAASTPSSAASLHSATHKPPVRISRSVSAFSRTPELVDVTLDFHKRDNPLFYLDAADDSAVRVSESDEVEVSLKSIDPSSLKRSSNGGGGGGGVTGRGRSVSRSSGGVGERRIPVAGNGIGRRLSTVDTGRRRKSPSRGRSGNFMCEERARKLGVELVVEEHRELELNKILHEITPEPKTPQIETPCAIRKASMERKMSKCLDEEAIAYFDECVSISTFDYSDFSSLEDPPSNTTGAGVACSFGSPDFKQTRLMKCMEDPIFPPNNDSLNRSNLSSSKMEPQYAITHNPPLTISLEQDVRNYVQNFSKDIKRENTDSLIGYSRDRKSTEDCTSQTPVEKFLLDRVIFRSRIESGSMLFCSGGFGLPFAF